MLFNNWFKFYKIIEFHVKILNKRKRGKMDYKTFINDLKEDTYPVSLNSYYHAFVYNHDSFIKMLNEGLKAKILLQKRGTGFNGLFYVSLSKCEKGFYSAYNLLKEDPAFIIDGNLKTFKTINYIREGNYSISFCNTFLPFRISPYDDEYQRFLKVSPEKIKAIRYELSSAVNNEEHFIYKLTILQHLMQDLEQVNSSLPIIDADSHQIFNRQKVLALKLKK